MDKKLSIVGAGKLSLKSIWETKNSDCIIGVDRGAYWLIKHGIIPDVAIGDFDSVSKDELMEIEKKCRKIQRYPREKDFTDMELAVNYAVKLRPQEVIIYGAIGSRLDHSLSAIPLLERLIKANIKATIRYVKNELTLLRGETIIKRSNNYLYLSILPYVDDIVITIKGCKYSVVRKLITRGQTIGISNEILADKTLIAVHSGIALLIRSQE